MAQENDLVLIYVDDKPLSFARIEKIINDTKKGWFHVSLLLLQVPVNIITWILRDTYINGEEYSMGGQKVRLELVESPLKKEITNNNIKETDPNQKRPGGNKKASNRKVISLLDKLK